MTFVISFSKLFLPYGCAVPKHFKGENLPSQIIKVLRDERFRQGLSMNVLAQRAGLSQSSVSLLESERRKPTLETLLRLCDALSVDLWKVVKKASEKE
jgi:transcriptional regulator with XRE-family HTH domain